MTTIAPLRAVFIPRASALTNTSLLLGGTVFMSLMAQIALPVPGSPVPITGQTLGVLLIGTAYGASLGLATIAIYVALGLAGAPILAQGAHGYARLAGLPSGNGARGIRCRRVSKSPVGCSPTDRACADDRRRNSCLCARAYLVEALYRRIVELDPSRWIYALYCGRSHKDRHRRHRAAERVGARSKNAFLTNLT
jgi:hypothetical protein